MLYSQEYFIYICVSKLTEWSSETLNSHQNIMKKHNFNAGIWSWEAILPSPVPQNGYKKPDEEKGVSDVYRHTPCSIGTKGVYLSGGEQQRIAIARAMLKNAPILIMDEATAFADPDNEAKVQAAFAQLAKGKSAPAIGQRCVSLAPGKE